LTKIYIPFTSPDDRSASIDDGVVELKLPAGPHRMTQQLPQFVADMHALRGRLLEMGTAAAQALRLVMRGLLNSDVVALEGVVAGDRAIDQLQIDLDDRCLHALALYQPVASDLRTVIATLRTGVDLERIGDQAVNISVAAQRYLRHRAVKPLVDVPRMGALAGTMVCDALEAFVSRDVNMAVGVLKQDPWLHALKEQILRELLTYMLSDASTIEASTQLLLISQHLERIGDHATNIAEDVIFIVDGRDVRHRTHGTPPDGSTERRSVPIAPLL
jgi:phosphate transport system protein